MTIDEWLTDTTTQFSRADIPSARLDAELLLCHMLGVERSYLRAHGDESLARIALTQRGGVHPGGIKTYGDKLVLRRLQRQPIAYLLGTKEFYGREFIVSKDVLVPRPETEALIELAKTHNFSGRILDVGTGSGALGLTLALELANTSITVSDRSSDALEVAKKNAKNLRIKQIKFVESDLLEHWLEQPEAETFDAIVANLPYVDKDWERSPETKHEPAMALFAADGGLELIKQLIDQTPSVLTTSGYLLLEADPEQHEAIIAYARAFSFVERQDYALLLQLL